MKLKTKQSITKWMLLITCIILVMFLECVFIAGLFALVQYNFWYMLFDSWAMFIVMFILTFSNSSLLGLLLSSMIYSWFKEGCNDEQ